MKITYYGTAAAEGIPALFCNCPACQTAKHIKGKNIRTRSQMLVNDDLLIDYPPDTYLHVINYGLDLENIDNILITHSHEDHLYPQDLIVRCDYYSPIRNPKTLNIFGNKNVIEKITEAQENTAEFLEFLKTATLNELKKYEMQVVGNYNIYPLKANHKENEDAFIYIIIENNKGENSKTILYGHDTGYFVEDTWTFLKGFKFDFVSLDCTCVYQDCRNGHMGIECCNDVKTRMIEMGVADEHTNFTLHHFSHNGQFLDHDNIVQKAKTYNMDVSFDGKEINL